MSNANWGRTPKNIPTTFLCFRTLSLALIFFGATHLICLVCRKSNVIARYAASLIPKLVKRGRQSFSEWTLWTKSRSFPPWTPNSKSNGWRLFALYSYAGGPIDLCGNVNQKPRILKKEENTQLRPADKYKVVTAIKQEKPWRTTALPFHQLTRRVGLHPFFKKGAHHSLVACTAPFISPLHWSSRLSSTSSTFIWCSCSALLYGPIFFKSLLFSLSYLQQIWNAFTAYFVFIFYVFPRYFERELAKPFPVPVARHFSPTCCISRRVSLDASLLM